MNLHRTLAALLTTAALAIAPAARGQECAHRSLTLADARQVVDTITAAARAHHVGAAVAVVDAGGNLLLLERLDGTFAAGAMVSMGKARTAALFQKPTRVFEELINKGRTAMAALPDFTPLQGGVPIEVDGRIVGAVGVSGAASAQQDEEFALLGAKAVGMTTGKAAPAGAGVAFFPKTVVDAAFGRGAPLLEVDAFKIHASRREGPGQAEIHADETDVIYVTGGAATFVTGGKVVDGKTTAQGEIRGSGIAGGETRRLVAGDVITVPAGTPHWFQQVDAPFTYYVVKVIGSARS